MSSSSESVRAMPILIERRKKCPIFKTNANRVPRTLHTMILDKTHSKQMPFSNRASLKAVNDGGSPERAGAQRWCRLAVTKPIVMWADSYQTGPLNPVTRACGRLHSVTVSRNNILSLRPGWPFDLKETHRHSYEPRLPAELTHHGPLNWPEMSWQSLSGSNSINSQTDK